MSRALPRLSPRLLQAAAWVRDGVSVADVGTDHGYLCAYLANSRASDGFILAADVADKPLLNAADTLEQYGLNGRVELRLSDGLDNIMPHEADDILMLGMGGTLIVRLLDRCGWLKDENKRLILQPMTRAEELRAWLCSNGFTIQKEAVVREGRRLYILIYAAYAGIADPKSFPIGYEYYGRLPELKTADATSVLERNAQRLNKQARALKAAGKTKESRQPSTLAEAVIAAAISCSSSL